MQQPTQKKLPLTIWSFVGFIFIIYGLIITSAGIYYKFNPHVETSLHHLDPSLWWGLFLLIIGLVFYWFDLKNRKKPD